MKQIFIGLDGKEYSLRFYHFAITGPLPTGAEMRQLRDIFEEAFRLRQVKCYGGRQRSIPYIRACTICTVDWQDSVGEWINIRKGFSFCSSRDQYNKKRGRQIAFGRVLRELSQAEQEKILSQVSV